MCLVQTVDIRNATWANSYFAVAQVNKSAINTCVYSLMRL